MTSGIHDTWLPGGAGVVEERLGIGPRGGRAVALMIRPTGVVHRVRVPRAPRRSTHLRLDLGDRPIGVVYRAMERGRDVARWGTGCGGVSGYAPGICAPDDRLAHGHDGLGSEARSKCGASLRCDSRDEMARGLGHTVPVLKSYFKERTESYCWIEAAPS